ncbi:MAG: VCBS domain-containing protein, partial [Caldilineaceae bacterium]
MALSTDAGGAPSIVLAPSVDGKVHVPDSDFLYGATFIRSGSDLKLVGEDGQTILVPRYFDSDAPPSLVAPDSSGLSGETVSLLAGPAHPGQYTQATAPDAPAPIGEVVKAEGEAEVQRVDGTKEALDKGDPIFQNDVVEVAGSSLGIRFSDGTLFNMSAGTKMVINNLVYDPDSSSNSALFNIVKGTFSMVGGKIVDSGEMDVATPIATMGIRGTAAGCSGLSSGGGFCIPLPGHDNVIQITTEPGNPQLGDGQVVTSEGIGEASGSQLTFAQNEANSLKELQDEAEDEDEEKSSSAEEVQDPEIKKEDSEEGASTGQSSAPVQQNEQDGTQQELEEEEESTEEFFVQEVEELDPVASNPPVAVDDLIAGGEGNAVVEAGADAAGSPQGTGNVLDNDSGDGLTVVSIGASPAIPVTGAGTTIVGIFGSLQIFPDGSYTYTLDNADPDTQALAQSEQGFEFFVYTVADSSGLTAEANLIVTVNGANDAPVAIADNNTNAPDPVVEDGDPTASGSVLSNDTDVDNGAVLTVAAVNGNSTNVGIAVTGTYGSVIINSDGSYTYTLDNADPDTQALGQGEVVTEEFQYTVTDEYGATDTATLTLTITGADDAPTLQAVTAGSIA